MSRTGANLGSLAAAKPTPGSTGRVHSRNGRAHPSSPVSALNPLLWRLPCNSPLLSVTVPRFFAPNAPLSDDQIHHVAPSIFAVGKHDSRSDRYTYIPTIDVLRGLRNEGFEPFMVCQTRVRDQSKREYTKHMLRLRHADTITGDEANEIVLLNSHDGTSSYQMLAGMLRFVCQNGMVAGENVRDVRVPHKGNIVQNVINGAFDVLDGFDLIREQKDGMQAVTLNRDEQTVFARSALALRYDPTDADRPCADHRGPVALSAPLRGSPRRSLDGL